MSRRQAGSRPPRGAATRRVGSGFGGWTKGRERPSSTLRGASCVAALALLGCVASPGGPDGAGAGGNTGGTASGGAASAGGFTGTGGGPVVTEPTCTGTCTTTSVCESSVVGPALMKRLTARELEATLRATFPEAASAFTSSLSPDPVSHLGFDNEAAKLLVTNQVAREIDATAQSLADAVSGDALASLLPCSQTAPDRACAGEFLSKYGKRLFRRPLASSETEAYLGFFDDALAKTGFAAAIGWVTKALVHAPATLYRSEVGASDGTARRLSQYEVASELAFTFTGKGPSDDLLARADEGTLSSPEVLVAVAKELLQTPEGIRILQRFFEGALEYGRVTSLTKSSVPDFPELRVQMLEETRRFVEAIVVEQGGGLKELLTSPTTYPTSSLAAHYGIPTPPSDYAQVERPSGLGLLAQGSILSTEASATGSSPTQRGLLVFEKLLCNTPPPVPADVPELPEPVDGVRTTRQRYEEDHAAGTCGNCHQAFDPIGFGFEHFDEAGRFRSDEFGLPIDSSGSVPGTSPLVEFQDLDGLALALAEMPEVYDCVTGQLKAYAFGMEEACLAESRRQDFASGAIGLLDYLASVAGEPHFVARRLP